MKSALIIKKLEQAGWSCVRQKGSHMQFRTPAARVGYRAPSRKSDMGVGTIKSIEKQSGIKFR